MDNFLLQVQKAEQFFYFLARNKLVDIIYYQFHHFTLRELKGKKLVYEHKIKKYSKNICIEYLNIVIFDIL